jgi:hypothetical protein
MNPEIDGRLADRIREIAAVEVDSWPYKGEEKKRVLNIAADVLEEYVQAMQQKPRLQ